MTAINTSLNSIASIPISRVRDDAQDAQGPSVRTTQVRPLAPPAHAGLSAQDIASLKESQALGTVTTALKTLGTTISAFLIKNRAQSPNASALTHDVVTFVAAYNQAVAQVSQTSQSLREPTSEAHTGETQPLLRRVRERLGTVVSAAQKESTYTINSAAALGITPNSDGTLAFDSDAFGAALKSDLGGAYATLYGDGRNKTEGLFETIAAYLAKQTNTKTGTLVTEARALVQDALTESSYARQVGYAVSNYQDTLRDKYAAVQGALASLHAEQQIVSATLEGREPTLTNAPPTDPFEMPGETAYGAGV